MSAGTSTGATPFPQDTPSPDLQALAARLVRACSLGGLTLGTCESLTGGLVAASLTAVPGASRVVRGGLVTYASDLKHSLASVDAELIATRGVVNEDTARQMADGARRALGVDLALACTGVAGPDPQDGEQPGTVWIALARTGAPVRALRLSLPGDRTAVRTGTVQALLGEALAEVSSLTCSL